MNNAVFKTVCYIWSQKRFKAQYRILKKKTKNIMKTKPQKRKRNETKILTETERAKQMKDNAINRILNETKIA